MHHELGGGREGEIQADGGGGDGPGGGEAGGEAVGGRQKSLRWGEEAAGERLPCPRRARWATRLRKGRSDATALPSRMQRAQ